MRSIIALMLCLSAGLTQAQLTDSLNNKRIQLKFDIGLSSTINFQLSEAYWQEKFPGMLPATNDSINVYQVQNGISTDLGAHLSGDFEVYRTKRKGLFMVRASIGTGPRVYLGNYYSQNEDLGIIDTIYSSYHDTYTYVNLMKYESYHIVESFRLLQLGSGLTYTTNPEKLLSLQTGLLVNYSFGFVNSLRATKMAWYGAVGYGTAYYNYESLYPQTEMEEASVTINKMINNVQLQVPIEFGIRLGKAPKFSSQMRLCYELNPGVNMTFFDGMSNYALSLSQNLALKILF